ncbi:MFS peptide transporter Ptr2 [Perkinsela sp. CCAP 1560/4]|nr:MFS peptide transporter Ptr2 [Perkinsela sp. CCAP 1560/4]|eukprot:KNH04724.1 MFS peptide transporter Ptr2 [Perkinsela sp. CCAP 1560/4]
MSENHYIESFENFLEFHFGKAVSVAAKKYILEHFIYRIIACFDPTCALPETSGVRSCDLIYSSTRIDGYPMLKDLEEFHAWIKKAPPRIKQTVEYILSGPYGVTLVQVLFDGLDAYFHNQKGNKGLRYAAKRLFGKVPSVTMAELRHAICLEAIQPEMIDEILYTQLLPVLRCHHEREISHFFTRLIRQAAAKGTIVDRSQIYDRSMKKQLSDSPNFCAEGSTKHEHGTHEVPVGKTDERSRLEISVALKRLRLKGQHIIHIPEEIHYALFVRPNTLDKDRLKKYRLPVTMRSTKWELQRWYESNEIRRIACDICKTDLNISGKHAIEKLLYHFKRETEERIST